MKGCLVKVNTSRSVLAYFTKFWPKISFLFRIFMAKYLPVFMGSASGFGPNLSFSTKYTTPKEPYPSFIIALKCFGPTNFSFSLSRCNCSFNFQMVMNLFFHLDSLSLLTSFYSSFISRAPSLAFLSSSASSLSTRASSLL